MAKNDMTEAEHAYQSIQLALSAVWDATKSEDWKNIPGNALHIENAWRELCERTYMAARQAAYIAEICGDAKTANYTNNMTDSLIHLLED